MILYCHCETAYDAAKQSQWHTIIMSVKVKICGIRNIDQAKLASYAGADFIGLQFIPSSKRFIDPSVAKEISHNLKGKINLVGVFKNQSLEEVNKICNEIGLDYAQLHGNEDETFCNNVAVPVIKAFGIKTSFNHLETAQYMKTYHVTYYLIDREKRREGDILSLENAALLAKSFPLFLAGGLTPENVTNIVKKVKPFAVDVASGIETDGVIDFKKVKMFIKNAKAASDVAKGESA